MVKDIALEHAMNLVSESSRDKHTVDVYTPHETKDESVLYKEHIVETFDTFDGKIIGNIWGFVKKHLYVENTPMIFINGYPIIQGVISDVGFKQIDTNIYTQRLRNNVWYSVPNSSRYQCHGLDGEPHIMHIIKGGHSDVQQYFCVHESAFDPIGHKTELLTPLEIDEKYGIKL